MMKPKGKSSDSRVNTKDKSPTPNSNESKHTHSNSQKRSDSMLQKLEKIARTVTINLKPGEKRPEYTPSTP